MSDSVTLTVEQATVLRQTGRVEFQVEGMVCWYHSHGGTLDDGDDPCICAPPAKWAALDVECDECDELGQWWTQPAPGDGARTLISWRAHPGCHGTGRRIVVARARCNQHGIGDCPSVDFMHPVATVSVRVEPDGDRFRVFLTSVGGAE